MTVHTDKGLDLELAQAYIDNGDVGAAREILEPMAQGGIAEAFALLQSIPTASVVIAERPAEAVSCAEPAPAAVQVPYAGPVGIDPEHWRAACCGDERSAQEISLAFKKQGGPGCSLVLGGGAQSSGALRRGRRRGEEHS
jgi:hypothetical protein